MKRQVGIEYMARAAQHLRYTASAGGAGNLRWHVTW